MVIVKVGSTEIMTLTQNIGFENSKFMVNTNSSSEAMQYLYWYQIEFKDSNDDWNGVGASYEKGVQDVITFVSTWYNETYMSKRLETDNVVGYMNMCIDTSNSS